MKFQFVKDFGYLYCVSNTGLVFSRHSGDWVQVNPHKDKDGYLHFGFRLDGNRTWKRIHRLVAEAFIPNPNNLPVINHKDNNPENNHVNNLEWCTVAYNNQYRFKTGTMVIPKGEDNYRATLSNDVAKAIYIEGWTTNISEVQLAKKYNTTRSIVNSIRLGISYSNVTEGLDVSKTRRSNNKKSIVSDTGQTFDSIADACRKLHIGKKTLKDAINNRTSLHGMILSYNL